MPIGRRGHERYLAVGEVEFWTASMRATGDLLDVAKGGVLFRSADVPSEESGITVRFTVSGYSRMFEAEGWVVRAHPDSIAVMYFDELPGLGELLQRLERR